MLRRCRAVGVVAPPDARELAGRHAMRARVSKLRLRDCCLTRSPRGRARAWSPYPKYRTRVTVVLVASTSLQPANRVLTRLRTGVADDLFALSLDAMPQGPHSTRRTQGSGHKGYRRRGSTAMEMRLVPRECLEMAHRTYTTHHNSRLSRASAPPWAVLRSLS
jgi:hypothetical protein